MPECINNNDTQQEKLKSSGNENKSLLRTQQFLALTYFDHWHLAVTNQTEHLVNSLGLQTSPPIH